ncbi:MAG: ABC transporter permease [Anaerolineales bacterium]|jgi:ribose transport system permease protein
MKVSMEKNSSKNNGTGRISNLLRKNEVVSVTLAVLLLVFLIIARPNFLDRVNIDSLQTSIAPYGIMAIGMMVLLISGVFDLSVGSTMGLGGLVSAISLTMGASPLAAILAGILSGLLVGLINGVVVEIAGVNALITTIGTMYIGRGISEIVLVGRGYAGYTNFPEEFNNFGRGQLFNVYYMFWILIILVVVFQLVLRYTKFGRQLYFIGGNYDAAEKLGINNRRIRILSFVLSGVLAAFAGILVTARAGIANRYTGVGAHMDVIIACIIGGGSLIGGQGSIIGAFSGMVFMVLMSNAFNLYAIPPQWQSILVGFILLVVITVDGYVSLNKQKRLGKI